MTPRRLGTVEFVAMMATLFAMIALAVDAMLPGLPEIAAELSPDAANRAQLVIGVFMLGMGLGTFVAGPLADAYGRRPVVFGGIIIFMTGAILAYFANSLELLLAARLVQGIGVAGPRIAPLAMIRDIYEGRKMAQISSFVMMVFMLVPAVGPYFGALVIELANWRAIFIAIVVYAAFGGLWMALRQPETLARADRRPFRLKVLRAGIGEIIGNRSVMIYVAAMTLGFAMLVGLLSSTQQIYSETYGRADSFPAWFAGTALVAALGTILNAWLVMRIGMRRLVLWAFGMQTLISVVVTVILLSDRLAGDAGFALWFFWSSSMLFFVGLTFGNLNALALQQLGHIAGLAATVLAAVSSVAAVFFGGAVGLAF
ncbi:MAG: MFS transporter, partial [Paracoccaceae bacterium]